MTVLKNQTDASDLSETPTDETVETSESTETPGEPKPKKVLTIPSDRVKQIKNKAFKKGQNAERRKLDEQAVALGYSDWNDFLAKHNAQPKNGKGAHMASVKAETPKETPSTRREAAEVTPIDGGPGDRSLKRQVERLTREVTRLTAAKQRESHQRGIAEKRVKELESLIDAQEAQHELELEAQQAGISPKYVEFALGQAQKHLRGLDSKAIEAFKSGDFFKGLKDEHPYLFGTVKKDADTSSVKDGAGAAATEEHTETPPAAPKSAAAVKPAPAAQTETPEIKDAMVASVTDANAALKAKGLNFRFGRELPEARARAR